MDLMPGLGNRIIFLVDPPGFSPPLGGCSLLRWVFFCPGYTHESNEEVLIQKGEVVLIPASLSKLNVKIDENIEILEIYV